LRFARCAATAVSALPGVRGDRAAGRGTRIDVVANPDAVALDLRVEFVPGKTAPMRFGPAQRMFRIGAR
jgi:hypothetical protein